MANHYPSNPLRAEELKRLRQSGKPRLPAWRVWPNLKVVICWRSPMVHPYIELLAQHLGSIPQRDYILMASEGVIAIPFEDGVSGGALAVDTHFYEFIPEELADAPEPVTLLAHELELGRKYLVVLTTSAGLYRYNIGDVVHVRGFLGATPVIEFLHRTGHTCSLTGEKLTEDQVSSSVTAAASQLGLRLQGFTLTPVPMPFVHYALIAEFSDPVEKHFLKCFLAEVDWHLARANLEYKAKRDSHRLGAPELWTVGSGSYAALRQRRVAAGISDAQIKPACLTRDSQFSDNFLVLERIPCASAA